QDQIITFTSTQPATPTVGDTYNVTATANSGLAVDIIVDASSSSVCSISGGTVTFNASGSCVVKANQAGNAQYNAATQVQQTMTVSKKGQTITFTSTAPSTPIPGNTYNITATASSGLPVDITVDASSSSVCSISGSTVTFDAAGNCTLDANQGGNAEYNAASQTQQTITVVAPFPVAKGPSNVFAIPGNSQAVISWKAPSNIGTGTITGYTVTYGLTSGTTFTTAGCSTSSLTCTVTGLTNGTAYTFAVSTVTQKTGLSQTGPASLSGSATPTNGLAVSPSTLALSSLGSSHKTRIITLTNNSAAPVTLEALPVIYSDFTPALPSDVTIATTCSTGSALAANGGSCTLTITPGTTTSNDNLSNACTAGGAPQPSTFNVLTGSPPVKAVVLGYGCQYQGGYLFSIDDTTPSTTSINGKVVATTDQAPAYPNGINWVPDGACDNIWGIDDTSTSVTPSPAAPAATFQTRQLNCDAVNDGACATHNIQVFYKNNALTSYVAGRCRQPLTGDNAETACAGGATCYNDWYLPSTCDLGPFGSGGDYPSFPGSQSCSIDSTNIQRLLVNTGIASIEGYYWSSTEDSNNTQDFVWHQHFEASDNYQSNFTKINVYGIRCVRNLTN
ncbi:fibronectin type III domain-containing protein, partial [uncultured Legionella sp.]|uniref:fibronectin type III domain-containing protein n=1 Tax=uncultured Legionella sp. TaxID=210934 RepID=UPI00262A82B0